MNSRKNEVLPIRVESPMFNDPSVVVCLVVVVFLFLRAIKFSEMSILLGTTRFIEILFNRNIIRNR